MLTFLFWNLHKQSLTQSIARLVALYAVDVVILAEVNTALSPPSALLNVLEEFHYLPDEECPRIQIYTRFPFDDLPIVFSSNRYTIRALTLLDGSELLLVAAHLISLTNARESTLNDEAKRMAETIRNIENERGHRQTLLVGDLNLNPFDEGIVSARGLHGVMTKQIVAKGERTVQSTPYPFFYNPMWRHFGDNEPPGTYYYQGSDHVCYFWNLFDQVLLRPSLLERWDDSQLVIPISDSLEDLVSGRQNPPGGKGKSDHLPLVFALRL